jgi:hypothetical protein
MNARLTVISAVVGLIASVVTLIQAFTFTHLPTLQARYFGPGVKDNTLLEFLAGIKAHDGSVVMLDLTMLPVSAHPFGRAADSESVRWFFDSCAFAELLHRNCAFSRWTDADKADWEQTTRLIEANFSSGGAPWKEVHDAIADNGMSVKIIGAHQSVNPFSQLTINSEDADVAIGPYQVSIANQDGEAVALLSPAPAGKDLAAEVRCAKRSWPFAVKFLLCPFT